MKVREKTEEERERARESENLRKGKKERENGSKRENTRTGRLNKFREPRRKEREVKQKKETWEK